MANEVTNTRRPGVTTLFVLAGPEGAGKTTFYEQTVLMGSRLPPNQRPLYISPDKVQSELLGEPGIRAYGAGNQIANQQAREALKTGRTLVAETTFADVRDLRLIEEAKQAGYRVVLHHLQTSSPELSVARVHARVAEGGRNAPEAQIRADYHRSPTLIAQAAKIADHTFVYDSSALNQEPKHLLTLKHGRIVSQARELPAWARQTYGEPLRETSRDQQSAAARSFSAAIAHAERTHPGAQVRIVGHQPDRVAGTIVHETAHHVLQQTGKGQYAAHFKERLALTPRVGDEVSIHYGATRDRGSITYGPEAHADAATNKAEARAFLTLPREQAAAQHPRAAAAHQAADALARIVEQAGPRNDKVSEQVNKIVRSALAQRLDAGKPLEVDRAMVDGVRYNVALKSLDNALTDQLVQGKPQTLSPQHRDILVTRAEGVMRAIDGRVPMIQPPSQAQREAQQIAQRLASLDGPKATVPFRHNDLARSYRDAQKAPSAAAATRRPDNSR